MRLTLPSAPMALAPALLLLACGKEGDTGVQPAATFTEVQADILTPSCAFSTCHGGGGGAEGLSVAEGEAYAALVGVPSAQVPELSLVEPGDHSRSYLWMKCAPTDDIIEGPMPDASSGLEADRLERLASWIDAGAEDN